MPPLEDLQGLPVEIPLATKQSSSRECPVDPAVRRKQRLVRLLVGAEVRPEVSSKEAKERLVRGPYREVQGLERIMIGGDPTEPLELLLSLVESALFVRVLFCHRHPLPRSSGR
jgi:hypothetical protein